MDIREQLRNGKTILRAGLGRVKGTTDTICLKRKILLLLVLFCLSSAIKNNAIAGPGDQTLYPLGTTTAPYGFAEYLPVDYNTNSAFKFPLIIFLHGGGERGNGTTDLAKVTSQGLPKNIKNGTEYPAVIISPQSTGWNTSNLDKLLEYAKSKYRIDDSRIYVTGLSMGGGGSWNFTRDFYSKIAAVVPICGNTSVSKAENFVNMPIWAFHNDGDGTVSVNYTYGWINGIKAAGGNPKMTIYHKVGHDAWTQTYADQEMWNWLLAQKKGTTTTVNKVPVANAGPDFTINLPTNSTELVGSGTDSDGSIASYTWAKISGPAVSMANTTQSKCNLSNLVAGTYVFELSVKDDKTATSSDKMTLTVNSEPVNSAENGVSYAYYEGYWSSIPSFSSLTPKTTGKLSDFNLTPKQTSNYYAFNYQADIQIDVAGTYTFYVQSDDGSNLFIGSQKVVNNDGLHGIVEKSGSVYLTAGKHPINVNYIQATGGSTLKVSYSGPNFYKTVVPSSVLYPTAIPASDPPATSKDLNIINYSYYEGSWSSLPNFDALNAIKTGTVTTFSLAPKVASNYFGFKYEVSWECPLSGEYTFYLKSDDGSKLFINSNVVINNDGLHGVVERTGKIYLTKGVHNIKVVYFEKTGGESLELNYSGPGVTKELFIPSKTASSQTQIASARMANDGSITNEEFENSQLKAFPNPFNNYIKVSFPEDNLEEIKVKLFNLTGKLLLNKEITKMGYEIQIDLNNANLAEGAYILNVESPSTSKKIHIIKN